MNLDADVCYRATKSRDARFDGRFFIGVRTTGIYCRPICPAPTPLRKNIEFHACAAAAEEAGFRACLRCRPETAPGSPAWLGTSATVTRGLRFIAEGALDDENVDDFAARLGVGSRHLRRLFLEHVGATPIAVAQTRRVHFARKLVDETDLSITEIAFASGFASIRRFNTAFKKAFRHAPTDLRRRPRKGAENSGSADLRLRLAYHAPLDWFSMLDFLRLRATAGVESVDTNSYRRTIAVDGATGVIVAEQSTERDELLLTVRIPEPKSLIRIVERVRSLFDLVADPREIAAHLKRDELLAPSLDMWPGLRVPGAWDGFELAVRAVLGQQVSVKGATTLAGRLAARFGDPLPESGCPSLSRLFPRPEVLAEADLATIGLTGARIVALRRLAAAIRDGSIRLDASVDPLETRERLRAIPGIGAWTAEYIAMRSLHDPDAFPSSDLGLRRGAATNGKELTATQLLRRAERWRPWRAYAAMYLWKRYATDERRSNQREAQQSKRAATSATE